MLVNCSILVPWVGRRNGRRAPTSLGTRGRHSCCPWFLPAGRQVFVSFCIKTKRKERKKKWQYNKFWQSDFLLFFFAPKQVRDVSLLPRVPLLLVGVYHKKEPKKEPRNRLHPDFGKEPWFSFCTMHSILRTVNSNLVPWWKHLKDLSCHWNLYWWLFLV